MDQSQSKESVLILVLLLTNLAHVLDFVVMIPLGPKLMSELNISAGEFGIIVSLYTLAAAFSSLISTLWVDQVDRKLSILLLLLGFTVGNVLCAWAPSTSVLVGGRVLAGIFGGVISAVVYAIVGQLISLERRGKAAGILGTSFPIVSILGVPLALKAADFYGWRIAFWLVLGVSCLAFSLAACFLPSVPPEQRELSKKSLFKPLREAFRIKAHQIGVLTVMLTVLGGFTIVPYIAPFLINNAYIREDELYLVYLVGGCCSIVSSRILGGLTDAYGKVTILRWVLVLSIAALAFFTNLPHHSLGLVLVATSLAMMLLPGRFVCVMALLTVISDRQSRGAFMSLASTIQQATIGIASIIGGVLVGERADGSLSTFWLAGLVAIAANLVVLLLTRRLRFFERQALTEQV